MSRSEYYSEFRGQTRSIAPADAEQVSFLLLENIIPNRIDGALVKRPGSKTWATTGDVLGMGIYSETKSSYRIPNTAHIIRHRRSGGTSSFQKYNWSGDTWDTITLGANTSFGASGIAHFAQGNALLAVCAGRPAKLVGISEDLERLGGPAPTTAPTWTVDTSGSLTGRTMGYYTFYDSTSGWESSPSPVTSLTTLAADDIDWSALETTCAREGVDQKRLYRTQLAADGSMPFYRVATVSLATTTYADSVADASLTAVGATTDTDFTDHDPPPTDSYICAEYAGCLWVASGSELWRSKPYDGNLYQYEYFSPDRVFRFPQRIMGLAYTPEFGRLLVFCPPGHGIHYVSGRSESTFEQDVFNATEGTNFPSSIAAHQNRVVYWGQSGPTNLTPAGVATNFGDNLREDIRTFSTTEYNSDVYIFALWHSVWKTFLFFASATDSATAAWEDISLLSAIDWEDTSTGADVIWG